MLSQGVICAITPSASLSSVIKVLLSDLYLVEVNTCKQAALKCSNYSLGIGLNMIMKNANHDGCVDAFTGQRVNVTCSISNDDKVVIIGCAQPLAS